MEIEIVQVHHRKGELLDEMARIANKLSKFEAELIVIQERSVPSGMIQVGKDEEKEDVVMIDEGVIERFSGEVKEFEQEKQERMRSIESIQTEIDRQNQKVELLRESIISSKQLLPSKQELTVIPPRNLPFLILALSLGLLFSLLI